MPRFLLLALLLTLSCTGPSAPPVPTGPPGQDVLLTRHPEIVTSLTLAATSRPASSPIPMDIPLEKRWRARATKDGVTEWVRPTPFKGAFFNANSSRQPAEMTIRDGSDQIVPFLQVGQGLKADTWGYEFNRIILRTRSSEAPSGYTMRFPWATQLEKSRNLGASGLEDEAFAFRSIQVEGARQQGLFLPAPSSASFKVSIDGEPRLRSRAHLLLPAVQEGVQSTGASLEVTLRDEAGATTSILLRKLEMGTPLDIDLDLSGWAGQTVELTFKTGTEGEAAFDYVFLTEPGVVHPDPKPRRVALLFADTLRADHTTLYGYERDTTPRLGAWASERAVVFEQARSVASWTMPSARSAVSGREPERWVDGQHMGTSLAREGFVTVLISANIYLTDVFGFADGWSEYRYVPSGDAHRKAEVVQEVLEKYPYRDIAVVVQVMDPHFAYHESGKYRGLFEGDPPHPSLADRLTEDEVRELWLADEDEAARAALIRYTKARYDQNIRVVDDAFADMIDDFGEQAVTVFFSDHGEEWFEHGRLAHGHFVHDSSIKVPLAISAPGVPPGRVKAPAALTDIVPTVLDLLDVAADESLDGESLAPLMRPDASEADLERLSKRPTAFGWGLFGDEAWGSLLGHHKYVAQGTEEYLFDLSVDPGETKNLAGLTELAPYRDALAEVRGRRVVQVVRVAASGTDRMMKVPVSLEISHPDGVLAGWSRWQHMRFGEVIPHLGNGTLRLKPPRHGTTPREVFALMSGEPEGLVVRAWEGTRTEELTVERSDGHLGDLSLGGGIAVDQVWRPLPVQHADVKMTSALEEALEALGYVEH